MKEIGYKPCHLLLLLVITITVACNREEPGNTAKAEIDATQPEVGTELSTYIPQSSDDSLASEISAWLAEDYLKDEVDMMREIARQYQYFATDLNGDGVNEIVVNFIGPWFCGSGGCTILLLDNEFNLITRFTVMQTPLYAETTTHNGWKILLVRSEGELKELKYENDSYPSNPSVLEKAPYDAPSGHAIVMFDRDFAPAKTYGF